MKYIISLLFLAVVVTGCGGPPKPVYDQPTVVSEGYYETAWIEPQIIYSDSLLTLIQAKQVDSFYVEQKKAEEESPVTSLSFRVYYQPCFTIIRVIDANSNELLRLFEQPLSIGHYKINCNRFKINQSFPGMRNLFLKADICGASLIEPLE